MATETFKSLGFWKTAERLVEILYWLACNLDGRRLRMFEMKTKTFKIINSLLFYIFKNFNADWLKRYPNQIIIKKI